MIGITCNNSWSPSRLKFGPSRLTRLKPPNEKGLLTRLKFRVALNAAKGGGAGCPLYGHAHAHKTCKKGARGANFRRLRRARITPSSLSQARAPAGPHTHAVQPNRVTCYIGKSGKCIALAHSTTMFACRQASMREGWMESLLYSLRCACA